MGIHVMILSQREAQTSAQAVVRVGCILSERGTCANQTCALYLNSLHKGRKSPGKLPVKNIDSPMLREWFGNLDGHVLASSPLSNMLVILVEWRQISMLPSPCTLALTRKLWTLDFRKRLPSSISAAHRWRNDDFVAATQVLIKHYERGIDSIPSLTDIFAEMSVEIAKLHEHLEKKRLEAQNRKKSQRKKQFGKQSTLIGFMAKAKKHSHPNSKSAESITALSENI